MCNKQLDSSSYALKLSTGTLLYFTNCYCIFIKLCVTLDSRTQEALLSTIVSSVNNCYSFYYKMLFTNGCLLDSFSVTNCYSISIKQGWASVLLKRTFRSLHSFPFFIKERSDLCVLFRSL